MLVLSSSQFDPERTFDRLDNGESVYAPVEHPRVWTNAPDGSSLE